MSMPLSLPTPVCNFQLPVIDMRMTWGGRRRRRARGGGKVGIKAPRCSSPAVVAIGMPHQ